MILPLFQLTAAFPLTSSNIPLLSYRAIWYQININGFWPLLKELTYYWVVVTPKVLINLQFEVPAQGINRYNGVIWSGLDITKNPLPSDSLSDPLVFSAREMRSSMGPADFAVNNQPQSTAAVSFLQSVVNWRANWGTSPRFTNWAKLGSNIRYGIQVIGFQLPPSSTPTATSEFTKYVTLLTL